MFAHNKDKYFLTTETSIFFFLFFHPGWYEDNWYEANLQSENISCTKDEMKRAAEGHLTTEALMWNQNNQKTISGMSSEDFRSVKSQWCCPFIRPVDVCRN